MKHWLELSDDEFVEIGIAFSNKEAFARSIGLARSTAALRRRIDDLIPSLNRKPEREEPSRDEFEVAVLRSKSIGELILNLGYSTKHPSRYREARRLSDKYEIPLPKWDPFGNSRSCAVKRMMTDEEFFSIGSVRGGPNLRHRMVSVGVPYVCSTEECPLHEGNMIWCGKQIVLQVDHIDGNPSNNVLSNLRFLCANCHTQTETFGQKRFKKKENGRRICSCGRNVSGKLDSCTHI